MDAGFDEVVRQVLAAERASRRRRYRKLTVAASLFALAATISWGVTLAVLSLNEGKSTWAALIAGTAMAFGFLNGLYFVIKDVLAWLGRDK